MAGAVEGEVVRCSHANVALAHGAPRRGLLDLPARLDDAVRLLPLEEGEGRVVVLGNRAGGRRMGERVLRRHGGDRGTRRGRQGASDATRGVSCDRGGSDNEGSRVARARGPCPTPVRAGARAKEARLGGASCLERLEERLEQRRLAQARLADHHQVERLTGWVAREARLHAPVVVRVPCRRTHRA